MSIARDAGYNLAAAVAPAIFTLAAIPFYIHAIGTERFGILAICWTLISTFQFASLGMGPALTYFLATTADELSRSRSSLVWTSLIVALATAAGGAVLVVAIGEIYFGYIFHSVSGLDTEIRRALPLLAALLPLSVIIGVLNGALQGSRRFGSLSAISILNAALITFTPLAAASLISVRIEVLILAAVTANAALAAIELVICAKLIPLQLPCRPKRSDVKTLLGYGAWISGSALIAPLVMLLDRFIIGALRGPTAVAVYVLPYNLVQQIVLLPASLTSAVLPRLVVSSEQEVRKLQSASLLWLNGLLTPLSICGMALAGPFFTLWIGGALAKVASPVAAVLFAGAWLHGICHIPSSVVTGRSRPDVVTKLLLAYLLPYVAILYLATLHFGVIGAAAAWTVRSAFDPVLFLYTRPYASDMRRIAGSAALVLAAMIIVLMLPWASGPYWCLILVITTASSLQNRKVLLSSVAHLRIAFANWRLTGEPPCAS